MYAALWQHIGGDPVSGDRILIAKPIIAIDTKAARNCHCRARIGCLEFFSGPVDLVSFHVVISLADDPLYKEGNGVSIG